MDWSTGTHLAYFTGVRAKIDDINVGEQCVEALTRALYLKHLRTSVSIRLSHFDIKNDG